MMSTLRHSCIAAIIFTGISLSCFSQTALYDYQLREVTKGVYATVRPEPLRHAVEGNFVFLVNEEDVVAVDAGGSPKAARLAIQDLTRITDKPVSYLVNTHFHGDHSFGNQAYKAAFPNLEIVASRPTAEVMFKRAQSFSFYLLNEGLFNRRISGTDSLIHQLTAQDSVKNQKIIANLRRHKDQDLYVIRELYRETTITPPTLVFDRELSLHRGEREIKILHLGSGDTPGDTWVFLPKEKILITGDAVVHPIPYGFSPDPVEWVKTLEKAAALDFDILIPGHGDIQYGKAYLLQLINLLKSMIRQIGELTAEEKSPDVLKSSIDIRELEAKFTGGDPFLSYYFAEYFKDPITETLRNYFLKEKK